MIDFDLGIVKHPLGLTLLKSNLNRSPANMEPFFNVVIPTYNREVFLKRCLDSMLGQEYQNWEAVVVDDGSTDNTRSLVKEYDDDRIRYFFKENGGTASARNAGINNSEGKYIAFLDSDDEYTPDHLQSIYNFLEEKDFPICLIFTDFIINSRGIISLGKSDKFLTTKPNFTNLPWIQTTAIHREAIGSDRLNEDLVIREDHEFLDRIRFKVPCYRVKNNSVIIHRHDSNITGNTLLTKKEMEKSIRYYIRTRKKVSVKELSKLYSLYTYLTFHYFREKKGKDFGKYLAKMLLLSPICLFHYPSLKSTLKKIGTLAGFRKPK